MREYLILLEKNNMFPLILFRVKFNATLFTLLINFYFVAGIEEEDWEAERKHHRQNTKLR